MKPTSPSDMMAAVSDSIQQRTGKTLDKWVEAVLVSELDPLDQKSVRKWLKSEHGIAQNTQWAIADAAARAAGWVRPSPDGYIDSQYTGKKAVFKPIFNAVRAAIMRIDPLVESYIKTGTPADADVEKICESLIEMDFLVEDPQTSLDNYCSNVAMEVSQDTHLKVVIVVTSACNMMCPYCYEHGIDRNVQITSAFIDNCINHLKNYILANSIESLHICLFGGEPTTFWNGTIKLMQKIKSLTENLQITLSCDIVTNGFLFSIDKVIDLVPFNLTGIQISLDGSSAYHNRRRFTKHTRDTYSTILENISAILLSEYQGSIYLRINIDSVNIPGIRDCISDLAQLPKFSKIQLSFGFITPTINDSDSQKFINMWQLNECEMVNAYIDLLQFALATGFDMPLYYAYDSLCIAKTKHSHVISPDGSIQKCLSMVGRKVGTVSYVGDKIDSFQFVEIEKLLEPCKERMCPYIPLCFGGCRFDAFLSTGDFHGFACRKDLTESINKRLLLIQTQTEFEDIN
ncbi:MAG: radical SAM protein [Anaerolineaceae bacterium]